MRFPAIIRTPLLPALITLILTTAAWGQSTSKLRYIRTMYGFHFATDPTDSMTVWVGGFGLWRLDLRTGTWMSYSTLDGLPEMSCSALFVTADTVWVGTSKGAICAMAKREGRFRWFRPRLRSLPFESSFIRSIAVDSTTIWFGTNDYMYRFGRATPDSTICVRALGGTQVEIDGRHVWFTTYNFGPYVSQPANGGVVRFDYADSSMRIYRYPGSAEANTILTFVRAGDSIWAASNRGVWIFNATTGEVTRVDSDAVGHVDMIASTGSVVWAGVQNRLWRIDRTSGRVLDEIRTPFYIASLETINGHLAAWTPEGLRLFDTSGRNSTLYPIPPNSLPWRTLSRGVTDGRHLFFSQYGDIGLADDRNLVSDSIFWAPYVEGLFLRDGRLWADANTGMIRLDTASFRPVDTVNVVGGILAFEGDSYWCTRWNAVESKPFLIRAHYVDGSAIDTISTEGALPLYASSTDTPCSLAVEPDTLWLSYSGYRDSTRLVRGVLAIDRRSGSIANLAELPLDTVLHAPRSIVAGNDAVFQDGPALIRISKDGHGVDTLYASHVRSLTLRGKSLWALGDTSVMAFDVATGRKIFELAPRDGFIIDDFLSLLLGDRTGWILGQSSIGMFDLDSIPAIVRSTTESTATVMSLRCAPNPARTHATIALSLSRRAQSILRAVDCTGFPVATLFDGMLEPGTHSIEWATDGLSSGLYFLRLECGASTLATPLVIKR